MPLNGAFFPRLTAAAGCDQLSNFQWSLAISRWFDIDRHPLSPVTPTIVINAQLTSDSGDVYTHVPLVDPSPLCRSFVSMVKQFTRCKYFISLAFIVSLYANFYLNLLFDSIIIFTKI